MNNEERLNTFIRVFVKEIEFHTMQTGSEAISCALTSFGADLGILDNDKLVRLDGDRILCKNLEQDTCQVTDLFAHHGYIDEARLSAIMYNSEYKSISGVYASDKEAFIRNLARIALREDRLDKYLMHRAVCNMAKELGIISETIWNEVIDMPLDRYDYYGSIRKLRFFIDLKETESVAQEDN